MANESSCIGPFNKNEGMRSVTKYSADKYEHGARKTRITQATY